VVHNDDTGCACSIAEGDPSDDRTGVFTSGIVSVGEDRKIPPPTLLGSRHAGENLAEVLRQRSAELPSPIQMCDALFAQCSEVPAGVEILLANCSCFIGRRQFVECGGELPQRMRYVLEMLGQVGISTMPKRVERRA